MKRSTLEHPNDNKGSATPQTNILSRLATIAALPFKIAGLPFKFVLNCAKLLTEFVPLVFVDQTAERIVAAYAIEHNPNNSQMTQLLGKAAHLALTPLYYSFKVIYFVGRSITSPQNNATAAYFTVRVPSEDEIKAAVHYDEAADQLFIHAEIDRPAQERKALGMQVLGVISTGVFWVITYRLLPPVCHTVIMGTGLTALTVTAVTKIIAYAYPNTPAEASNTSDQLAATAADHVEVEADQVTRSQFSRSLHSELRNAYVTAYTAEAAADDAASKAETPETELQFDLQVEELPTPQDDNVGSLRHRHPQPHNNNE